jgi:hypothetical protein
MPPLDNIIMGKTRAAATGATNPIVNPLVEPKQGDP